jgi:hypothetical protein
LEGYVLGQTPRVPISELDIVGVLEGVIERVKPLLKYLPYFKPLAELLNGGILVGCATRRTDLSLVEFPEGMSERTKAIEIQELEECDVRTTSTRRSLVFTEAGVILIWSAAYDRPVTVEFTGGRDEVAKESRFEIFDNKKLRDALSQGHMWKVNWRKVLFKILTRLLSDMGECIEVREKYLRDMKDAHGWLRETVSRIQKPF